MPGTGFYPLVIGFAFFSFLQNLYQKAYFTNCYSNIRHSETEIKGVVLSEAVAETKLFYTEIVILLLSLLLPFQESIAVDIQRISIFLFSFNCFTLLFYIKPLKEIVESIFRLKVR